MKKIYLLFLVVWVSFTSCSQLSPTLVKSKYTADQVLRKLEFTQPYTVTTSTPVTFGEKIVSGDFNTENYQHTPWADATKGREFIIVEYADPKQKTEWGYLYQVYLWKDCILPFFVNRGDGMGLTLRYNGISQACYRVNYSPDLYRYNYPTLVEPNQILNFVFMEKEWVVRKDKMKVQSYVFNADESNGVELIARTEEPCKGSILITFSIKIVADDAWIAIDKTVNSYKVNCNEVCYTVME
ncbi:hypothetical protein [Myroides odoratus]|uniref:hypothetical protein n=1 Tax=Myroides odoratus TaxID=256 RepID=UPI00333FBBAA